MGFLIFLYLLNSARFSVTFAYFRLSTTTDIVNYYDNYSNNMPSHTYYRFVVSHSVVGGYFEGGEWYVEGFKASNEYEWQMARSYLRSSAATSGIRFRVKQAGAWKEWEAVS